MKVLKDRFYWLLMPPFFILTLLLFIYLPGVDKLYAFFAIILFWVIYYSWKYFEKKNKKWLLNHIN